ncbi:MAG: C25 family cysteine peptidase [Candidatus Electryoneaceae bacterium]|nr:C25 family cysteine peptidase [Candidatus Electryoneaceae bacterium]
MMRTTFCVVLTLLFFSIMPAHGANIEDNNAVIVETVHSGSDGFTIAITFPSPILNTSTNPNGSQRLWLNVPGTVPDFEADGPALPSMTRLIAVPDGYRVEAKVVGRQDRSVDVEPTLSQGQMIQQTQQYEAPVVEIGEPAWLRNLRVTPVVIRPARYNNDDHFISIAERMEVEFEFVPCDGTPGQYADHERYWSPDFEALYSALLLNPQAIPDIMSGGRVVERGSYIIITDDVLHRYTAEFVDWKQRKGFNVVVSQMVDDNVTADEIRNYIRDAYENWDRPPEYVLLLGDENEVGIQLPSFRIRNPGAVDEYDVTDLPYGLMTEGDYFPDIFIGRISVDSPNSTDVRNALRRSVFQDKTPSLEDPGFYHRATLFGCNFGEGDRVISSPVETCRWLGQRLRDIDYDVEEFYFEGPGDNDRPEPIIQSIDRGVNIVCYRGWADAHGTHHPQFYIRDLDRLNNGPMLPVATFFVCNVGDFGNRNVRTCFGEYSLTRGDYHNPTGFVAFFGPSDLHTSTKFNNPILAGYYSGLIDHNLRNLSQLVFAGKMEIWRGFPNFRQVGGDDNFVDFYFHAYNLLGDPDLNFFLHPPNPLVVTGCPEQLGVGETYMRIVVRREGGGLIRGALVTLLKDEEMEVSILTDRNGVAFVPMTLDSPGEVKLTIIAHQALPYLREIEVTAPDRLIGLASVEIVNHPSGIPTDTPVNLAVTLRNTGNSGINGITAELVGLIDDEIEVLQGESDFGNIAADGSAQGQDFFTVQVSNRVANGGAIPFQLNITDDQDNGYTALFRLETVAPSLMYVDHAFDGDVVDPGATTDLVLTVMNAGDLDADGLRATMHTFDASVEIVDAEAVFGDLAVDETVDCAENPFRIHIQDGAYEGRQVQLRTVFTDSDDNFIGKVFFNITIGTVGPTNPLGPDRYGYFAYEDIDTDYEEAPEYSWVELDPDFNGENGTLHQINDDTTTFIELPFTFQYYNLDYDSITVCDNGWLSFGETWMFNFRNWNMPSPLGPPALLAPFWEDLIDQDGDENRIPVNVFTWYDEEGGRFIIEWSRGLARSGVEVHEETFEVILYDPDVHETTTGDGEIVFQYHTVALVDNGNELNYATVGIEDHTHLSGLEVTFANHYSEACGELEGGRAIKFTTDAPDDYNYVGDGAVAGPLEFALCEPYPNPFNSRTTIRYSLESAGPVDLTLWDVSGRMVRQLAHGDHQAGDYRLTLDGGSLPTGLYLIRLESAGSTAQQKMLLVK